MNEKKSSWTNMVYMTVQTPLHVGCGEGNGKVDLPVQRSIFGYPIVEGSSWKGAIRLAKGYNVAKSTTDENGRSWISVIFSDMRLLCFPVKSSKYAYCFITCPGILRRFIKEREQFGITHKFENVQDAQSALQNSINGRVFVPETLKEEKYLYLQQYSLEILYDSDVAVFLTDLWKEYILHSGKNYQWNQEKNRIVVVSDEDFYQLMENGMEVVVRNQIDRKTGTTKARSLFIEEYVPEESVFYGFLTQMRDILREDEGNELSKLVNKLASIKKIQLGSGESLGKGNVYLEVVHNE